MRNALRLVLVSMVLCAASPLFAARIIIQKAPVVQGKAQTNPLYGRIIIKK